MSNCGCGCNRPCNPCNTNPCQQHGCRSEITQADLAELMYIKGLDENLCPKYGTPTSVLGLTDCAGNPLGTGVAVVTCAAFAQLLCTRLNLLPAGGVADGTTRIVTADCETVTLPPFAEPFDVEDTSCIDLNLVDGVLTATPIIDTENVTNVLECTDEGLYVPSVCEQFDNITTEPVPAGPNAVLITKNCIPVNLTGFQTTLEFNDTSCIELDETGGVVTATPVISPVVDNQLECTAQGLYVPPTQVTQVTVVGQDTDTVDITVSAGPNYTISADVIISDEDGNVLEEDNGLYVPSVCEQFQDINGIPTPAGPLTVFIDRDCLPRTLPPAAILGVDDTNTVDHTLTAGILTSEVNIAPIAGNILVEVPGGLAVRCTDVQACVGTLIFQGQDTDCFNITVNTVGNTTTISGEITISPAAGNQISCTPQGLYVPPPAVTAITCESVLAAFPTNPVALTPGDLVPTDNCDARPFPNFVAADNSCVDISIVQLPNGNFQFTPSLQLSPDGPGYPGCNGLVCAANGLQAPPDVDGLTLTTPILPDSYSGATVEGQVIVIPPVSLNVTNPSNCRQAILMLGIRIPEIEESETGVAPNRLEIDLQHQFSFPSQTLPIAAVTSWAIQHMSATDVVGTRTAAGMIINAFVMQPGESGTYTGYLTLTQAVGSLTNLRVDPVVLRAFLYTI